LRRVGFATLLLFDLILFAPLLISGRVFSSLDFLRAHHPWRQGPSGVLRAENPLLSDPAGALFPTLARYRELPEGFFWNPWVSGGTIGPFHIAQGFLSPFALLPALLLPEAAIETGVLFLKFNFAFLACYAFLRSRCLSDLASACGAAAWAFSTVQTVWGLWMHTSVSVTYPLLLLAVDRAFEDRRAVRAAAIAAACFLLFLSGGFPHFLLYGALAALLYFFFRAAAGRRDALRALGLLSAAAAISVAAFLPSLLASARLLDSAGYAPMREGLGRSHALPLSHLSLYAFPRSRGTPRGGDYRPLGWIPGENYAETACGVGVAAILLAAVGLVSARRRGLAFYAAILGGSAAIPLYGGGRLLELAGSLPFLNTALFSRARILIVLALALLAACGAEALEELAAASRARRIALRLAPLAIAASLAICALDFHPVSRPSQARLDETPGIRRLKELQERAAGRFAAAGWTLPPNVSEAFHLEDARGHFLHEEEYRRLLAAADPGSFGPHGTYLLFDPATLDPHSPALDLLGIRRLAAPPRAASPVGEEVAARDGARIGTADAKRTTADGVGLPRIYDGRDMTIFARTSAFPIFRAVATTLPGGLEEARRADRETLATRVFVPPEAHRRLLSTEGRRGAGAEIRTLARRAERFLLETEGEKPTLLVTSQKRSPPYWRLFLDGKEASGFAANGLFLGLAIPEGRHRIEGRFMIPRRELAISTMAVLALGAFLWKGLAKCRTS